jgi:hypothetical protein
MDLKRQEGQSLVECALLFTLLAFMVVAMIDFATTFQTYVGLVNAANNAAVYAARSSGAYAETDNLQAEVVNESNTGNCTNPTVVVNKLTDHYGYAMVQATVTCRLGGLIVTGPTSNITMASTVTRRIQQ